MHLVRWQHQVELSGPVGTYTLSTSEGESTGCGLEFEQGDYAALNQYLRRHDATPARSRPFPPSPHGMPSGKLAHNQIIFLRQSR